MKTFTILATAAVAAIATPAFAQESSNNHDVILTVQGSTPAKCNIAADDSTIVLSGYDLTNDQGRVKNNVDQKVANALSALNLKAWCNGARNGVAVSRSALITGDGNATETGFNQAIVYDLSMLIDGATRDGEAFFDGTSDGPANGPGIGEGAGVAVPAFGPTGQGSKISFGTEAGFDVAAVTNGQGGAEVTRASFDGTENSAARMVAGSYQGTVTVTLTPGN